MDISPTIPPSLPVPGLKNLGVKKVFSYSVFKVMYADQTQNYDPELSDEHSALVSLLLHFIAEWRLQHTLISYKQLIRMKGTSSCTITTVRFLGVLSKKLLDF